MERIYLDYAATTPVAKEVLKVMQPYFSEKYGNASSVHFFGQEAIGAIDQARQKIADFFECAFSEIIFTGSATEANNLAIFGIAREFSKTHFITTTIEHESIIESFEELARLGHKITYLKCNKEGIVSVKDIEKSIRPNTTLVSIIYANNEVGSIQPIKEVGRRLEKINKERKTQGLPRIYFHTDAVQAIQYLECRPNWLKVDLMTFSGHKIYGPKGIGGLFIRKNTPLKPIILGGGQEFGLRSGTENTPLIVGLAAAFKALSGVQKSEIKRITALRNKLFRFIIKSIPQVRLNGPLLEKRLPNNLNFIFPNIPSETLLVALDQEGVAISVGSACQARSSKPSHVLRALGLNEKDAKSSVRISLGRFTTSMETKKASKIIIKTVKKLKSHL